MLKPNEFADKEKDKKKLVNIIISQIEKQGASFEEDNDAGEERRTCYLDTKQYALYKNNNFLLRIRKEPDWIWHYIEVQTPW